MLPVRYRAPYGCALPEFEFDSKQFKIPADRTWPNFHGRSVHGSFDGPLHTLRNVRPKIALPLQAHLPTVYRGTDPNPDALPYLHISFNYFS